VAHDVLTNPAMWVRAAKLLWHMSNARFETSPAQDLAEKIEARRSLLHWVNQSGFAEQMNASLKDYTPEQYQTLIDKAYAGSPKALRAKKAAATGTPLTAQEYVKVLENVYATMPKPLQERMTGKTRIGNFIRLVRGAVRVAKDTDKGDRNFMKGMTSAFAGVKYFLRGHDHLETQIKDKLPNKASFLNIGTWTKIEGEWRLNTVVARTGADGRILGGKEAPRLWRTDEKTGKATIESPVHAPTFDVSEKDWQAPIEK
jgi:hypothetical protein